ncbi:integrase [Thermococcus aciditolerans]|uniref:Integrase n=1 Tax=Thermococcus aciditolerans TaxID=2598455 RepID=A0A5C0SJS7_9EURY|nr:integrase [Thermococcus aciditolerans]QEK14561.1 integrase [Thermococcus aciditolerans]
MNPRPADYKGITLQTLNELWSQHKEQFREWLSRRLAKEKTVKDYYNALEKLFMNYTVTFDKRSIKEAIGAVGNKKRYAYGLRNFLKFLAEIEVIDEEFSKFLQSYAKAKTNGVREVYILDREVFEAWEHIKERREEAQLLFKLMVFSGVRLSQLVRMLSTFDPTLLQFPVEGIARYPIRELSKGKKRGFWVYMPSELVTELKRIRIKESTAWEWVTYKRVSANTIRKWHYTFLIRQGVPADIADFIQGRASQRVGATHYLNKTLLADEWYSAVVDELKRALEEAEQ